MSGGAAHFGETALRLAGLAGWHLGWSADQFWNATPAEMEAVIGAMLGAGWRYSGGARPARYGKIAGDVSRWMRKSTGW
jgi:hypothetical protein